MEVAAYIHELAVKARAAATALASRSTAEKNAALGAIADALESAKAEICAAILEAEMSAAAQLDVPLLAEAHTGLSWYDAK